VAADGSVADASATTNADLFHAALTSLGALGIITSLTLQVRALLPPVHAVCSNARQCEPWYRLRAQEQVVPTADLLQPGALLRIAASAQHPKVWVIPHTGQCTSSLRGLFV
jgi:FAD/FMN-containing dehydrogenase